MQSISYHLIISCRCSKYDWSGENADEPVWTGVSAKKKAPAKAKRFRAKAKRFRGKSKKVTMKKEQLERERAKVKARNPGAGGKGRMGTTKKDGAITTNKESRQVRSGELFASTEKLLEAKKQFPNLDFTQKRMHNCDFVGLANHSNPEVSCLILKQFLVMVVGVTDAEFEDIADAWLEAMYDKKAASRIKKMPLVWKHHKMGAAINNYKRQHGKDSWA